VHGIGVGDDDTVAGMVSDEVIVDVTDKPADGDRDADGFGTSNSQM
jgi:hypothetical protein